jgi:cytochrome c5
MRWGDKFWEMDLAPAAEYIAAIHTLLNTSSTNANATNAEPVAIYLSTEDPRAAAAFRNATPPNWTVYVDRTIHELDTYRPAKGNRASWTTRNTRGRAGLVALGSLLVALEANLFVLTTKSNWSRLLNELRKNVIHPRCGNCTRMIDLRPGEW